MDSPNPDHVIRLAEGLVRITAVGVLTWAAVAIKSRQFPIPAEA